MIKFTLRSFITMAEASTEIALASFFFIPKPGSGLQNLLLEKSVLRERELRPLVRIYYFMAQEVKKAGLVEFANRQSLSLTGVCSLIPGPILKDFQRFHL